MIRTRHYARANRQRRIGLTIVVAFAVVSLVAPHFTRALADATGTVDFSTNLQRIDGFGAAFAFQKGNLIHGSLGLTPDNQQKLVELLFSRDPGIGLSIVRLGIGSGLPGEAYDHMHSIEPTDPGGPAATPQYVWDHSDDNQVWLSQQAYAYGVRRFLAAPWSAPGYMKTTEPSSDIGGSLCGLLGTICQGPVRTNMGPADQRIGDDWRQAYANYLVQWIRFYQQEGVPITDLSLQNEPNFNASYASMLYSNPQAVEFIKVLGPTLQASGMPVSLACCDATGWSPEAGYVSAIEADPLAKQLVGIYSGHQYGSAARTPLSTTKTVWMTEWGLDGTSWNTAWDGGGSSASSDGIVLANDISDNLTLANVNAYVYWVAASLSTTRAFVQIDNPGPNYHVSKRLWAMGAFSRYIRPGAFRVPASTSDPNLKISAFRNTDGRDVINIINNATTAIHTNLSVDPGTAGAPITSYFTDETHSLSETTGTAQLSGQNLSVDLPPRSLTTLALVTRSNVALASNGAMAIASSTYTDYNFGASSAINGDRTGNNWGNNGGWNDSTPGVYPDTLEVDFNGGKLIDEIDVVTLQNNWTTAGEPDLTTQATGEGILDFDAQYFDGTAWVTVPNGSVTGNDKAWRQFTFPSVTTTKIRVVVNKARNYYSRIVQLEAFGTSP